MPSSWLPLEALSYCLTHTECRLIILDPERADQLEPIATKLSAGAGTMAFVVLESHEGKGQWRGMQTWVSVVDNYNGETAHILEQGPNILPEDNATIIFTSGMLSQLRGLYILKTRARYDRITQGSAEHPTYVSD